jgi:replication-associated recombination protein RarA
MFFKRSKLSLLFYHSDRREDKLFADVYGCDDIKKLFRMALESDHNCSILLTGPPAAAKTLFLQSLMKLKDSCFVDCSNATKSGIVDYVFERSPRYLLLDELDKLSRKDQTCLLNLIETGTSNNIEKIIIPLQSRFFVVDIHAYTYEQFYEIILKLLISNQYNIDKEIAKVTSVAVWKTSRNIRDVIKIATMAKSVQDVDWLVGNFL